MNLFLQQAQGDQHTVRLTGAWLWDQLCNPLLFLGLSRYVYVQCVCVSWMYLFLFLSHEVGHVTGRERKDGKG